MAERTSKKRIFAATAAAVLLLIGFALMFRSTDQSKPASFPETDAASSAAFTSAELVNQNEPATDPPPTFVDLNPPNPESNFLDIFDDEQTNGTFEEPNPDAFATDTTTSTTPIDETPINETLTNETLINESSPSTFTQFAEDMVVRNKFVDRHEFQSQGFESDVPNVRYMASEASHQRVPNRFASNSDNQFIPDVKANFNIVGNLPKENEPAVRPTQPVDGYFQNGIIPGTEPSYRIENPYVNPNAVSPDVFKRNAVPNRFFFSNPRLNQNNNSSNPDTLNTPSQFNDPSDTDELIGGLVEGLFEETEAAVEPIESQSRILLEEPEPLPPGQLDTNTNSTNNWDQSATDFLTTDEPADESDRHRNVALAQPIAAPAAQGPSKSTQGTTEYHLAGQPKIGDRWKSETPTFDRCVVQTETILDDFSPDPIDSNLPYNPYLNQQVYQGKQLNANQRPLLELGQPWYQLGQLSPGKSFLGKHNNVNPQLIVFGDHRTAYASNTVNGDNTSQIAWELNTFWSLFVTGTERIVWGVSPFDNGGGNTRWLLDDDRFEFEGDFDFDFGYLEGDLGAITGGFIGETLPFDLPFAAGLTPIFIQNGIWINDALEGIFFTAPARNSPLLNISNFDITFAYVYDQIDSDAFEGDNSAAKAYAAFAFIEALNGYFEIDYAFLEDRSDRDRSYHNIGLAFTRRFGRFISHSSRVIANTGQDVAFGDQTADGVLLLSENSLITRNPYTVIPYFNFFAGFDTPQSFAGDQELVNTGILFESDGLTGYPTLDARAQDTFGYAVGLNLLAQDFSQQLILETAAVFRNDDSDLAGDQYGVGMRYQLPLSNSWIFRTDAMYGFFRGDDDDFGTRVELRKKF